MKNFLIVDDHAIVRLGIGDILCAQYPGSRFYEAKNGDECMEFVKKSSFDLIILDVQIPNTDSLGLTNLLLTYNSKLRILIYSMYRSVQYAAQYYKMGAKGYISKEANKAEFLKAIDMVLRNRGYIDEEFQTLILNQGGILRTGVEALTERELEIAQNLALGASYKEIAALLHLETSSVRTHKKNIFRKLKVKSLYDFLKVFNSNNKPETTE